MSSFSSWLLVGVKVSGNKFGQTFHVVAIKFQCCNQSVKQYSFSYLHYPLAPLVADLALLERIIVSDEAFNFHTCWLDANLTLCVKYDLQIIVHVLFITTLAFLQDCRVKLQWAPKTSWTASQGLMTKDQVGPWATQDPKTKWCWVLHINRRNCQWF